MLVEVRAVGLEEAHVERVREVLTGSHQASGADLHQHVLLPELLR